MVVEELVAVFTLVQNITIVCKLASLHRNSIMCVHVCICTVLWCVYVCGGELWVGAWVWVCACASVCIRVCVYMCQCSPQKRV